MKVHIVVNKKIYSEFKNDILPLNVRLFTDSYFYDIANYEVPLDLKGIENYLNYTDEVVIYATSTFIDFINILLILSFLKKNNYYGKVEIGYYFFLKKTLKDAMFCKVNLNSNDYLCVDDVIAKIVNKESLESININLPGVLNYINFYNMIHDADKFVLCLQEVIDEYDENIDEIATYLEEKYSNMGINKEYYMKFLEKYL